MAIQAEIKPTGSLELGYIDKNPNQALTSEGFYFKPRTRDGVRRFRSAALETCCPPPALPANTNSLEVIGCKTNKNPLPPPSTSLTRNQHLNLCQYYGSEIVYPIAEQSDEHQTSHGPDTDIESMTHASDSDFEEANQGSHSPLLYIKMKKLKNVPYSIDKHPKSQKSFEENSERNSATSKDALIDPEQSNSSITETAQDVQAEYATDNDISDKKLSECSNLSCTSDDFQESMKLKLAELTFCDYEGEDVGPAQGPDNTHENNVLALKSNDCRGLGYGMDGEEACGIQGTTYDMPDCRGACVLQESQLVKSKNKKRDREESGVIKESKKDSDQS